MADDKASDLEILHPERMLTLGGESIEVREFSFLQEMDALPIARPIIRDLTKAFGSDESPGFSAVEEIFYIHREAFLHLLELSTGKTIEWMSDLSGDEAQLLSMTFWSVNKRFFISRVVTRTIEQHPELAKKLSKSETSTAP